MSRKISKCQQQRFFSRLDQELDENVTFITLVAQEVYFLLAIVLNFRRLPELIHAPSWAAAFDLILINLALAGFLHFLVSLPIICRHLFQWFWFFCIRELRAHLASRRRIAPSHVLLPPIFVRIARSLVATQYRMVRHQRLRRPPALCLGTKAPFPLYQQANLLVAP